MLALHQVSYRYKKSSEDAIIGIDLVIQDGEIFGLLGPNGAGKTTLLSLISGILPCTRGAIAADGLASSDWRRGLSLVPQEYSFYPMLSLKENLHFFASVQRIAPADIPARVAQAVSVTGLAQALPKRASRCSGGLKRRLNLAIGLLNRPKLLLLDEPTVGVDPQSRAFILEAIKALAAHGTTVLYTSHYMQEVETICDRIAILDHGRMLLVGALDSLFERQRAESVTLRWEVLSEAQQASLFAQFPEIRVDGKLAVLQAYSAERLGRFLLWCAEQQVTVHSLHYGVRDLESLFLSLTHRSLRD